MEQGDSGVWNANGTSYHFLVTASSGDITFNHWTGSSADGLSVGTITDEQWTHVAVSNSDSGFMSYIDGTRVANVAKRTVANTTTNSFLMGARDGGLNEFNGFFENVRITVGTGRYTEATITVPTDSYPTT